LLALAAPAAAQENAAPPTEAGEKAEIRIDLPAGSPPQMSVSLGEGGVSLDLPRGVTYPLDFVAASSGMLRGVQVTTLPDARVRLELKLASGLIDGFKVDPGAVVITLRRRGGSSVADTDPGARYQLGTEDKIVINIAGHPDLTQQLVVGGNGTIVAPLVGEVTASGLSPREVASKVTELLARDYLVDPKVEVQVVEYRSKWVMVTGEVRVPGRVPLRGGSTLKDVLVDAGGITADAGEEVLITRAGAVAGAQWETLQVDREAFERGEANPSVFHGDIVNVRPALYVYLEGEIRTPGKQRIERGMTLLKALALAGGPTEWANRKSIIVRRAAKPAKDEVYNLKDLEARKVPDPSIRGGDIVIIKRRFL
jgi:polysaccharide export outer membrane protein